MGIQRYLSRLRRMLYVSETRKDEIIGEILNTIRTQQLAGVSNKEILAQLRPATEIAQEENQKANIQYKKSPWRWVCLAMALVCLLLFALQQGWISAAIPTDVGVIGGADGPTAILVSSETGSGSQESTIILLLAAMGLVGFLSLGKCPVPQDGASGSETSEEDSDEQNKSSAE